MKWNKYGQHQQDEPKVVTPIPAKRKPPNERANEPPLYEIQGETRESERAERESSNAGLIKIILVYAKVVVLTTYGAPYQDPPVP